MERNEFKDTVVKALNSKEVTFYGERQIVMFVGGYKAEFISLKGPYFNNLKAILDMCSVKYKEK